MTYVALCHLKSYKTFSDSFAHVGRTVFSAAHTLRSESGWKMIIS